MKSNSPDARQREIDALRERLSGLVAAVPRVSARHVGDCATSGFTPE